MLQYKLNFYSEVEHYNSGNIPSYYTVIKQRQTISPMQYETILTASIETFRRSIIQGQTILQSFFNQYNQELTV